MFKNHFFEESPKFFLSCFFPFDTSSWQNSAPGLSLLCWILVWEHGLIQLQEHRNVAVMVSISLQKMVYLWAWLSRTLWSFWSIWNYLMFTLAHLASCQRPLLGHDRLLQRFDCCLDLQQLSCFSRRIYWAQTDYWCRGIYNVDEVYHLCNLENNDTANKLFAAWCWWQ